MKYELLSGFHESCLLEYSSIEGGHTPRIDKEYGIDDCLKAIIWYMISRYTVQDWLLFPYPEESQSIYTM